MALNISDDAIKAIVKTRYAIHTANKVLQENGYILVPVKEYEILIFSKDEVERLRQKVYELEARMGFE